MVKILIVDDERSALNVLKLLIEKHVPGEKEIITASSAEEALSVLKEFNPSLLMLDIEMPHMNGFDLLNRIGAWDFDVIFTTAFDKYAIKAIRFSALDFLLKPIDIVDLQNAVNRHVVKRELMPAQQSKLVNNLLHNLQQKDASTFKMALSTMEGVNFIEPREIIYCEGDSNYTHFYLDAKKTIIVSRTLKEYDELLSDHGFLRIHKSYLVNPKHIVRIDNEGLVWLSNGQHLAISRRRKEEVLATLKNSSFRH